MNHLRWIFKLRKLLFIWSLQFQTYFFHVCLNFERLELRVHMSDVAMLMFYVWCLAWTCWWFRKGEFASDLAKFACLRDIRIVWETSQLYISVWNSRQNYMEMFWSLLTEVDIELARHSRCNVFDLLNRSWFNGVWSAVRQKLINQSWIGGSSPLSHQGNPPPWRNHRDYYPQHHHNLS